MVNRVWQTYRTVLFCRLFANYFALILIPVIVASVLTHFFVVRLIERDAETLNNTIMQHFSEQIDDTFGTLERDMVNMLSTVSVKSFLRSTGDPAELQQHYESIHSLMQQMNKLDSGNLVYKSFLYFANEDLVIDGKTYNGKDEYFREQYPIKDTDIPSYVANFTGKKSMVFAKSHTVYERPPYTRDIVSTHSNIAVMMSYPFNSSSPDVYLVVNLDEEKLRERLGIQEKWVTDTMLVNSDGSVLIANGSSGFRPDSFASMIRKKPEHDLFLNDEGKALTYTESRFDDSWYYVSMIDLPTLLKPAHTIRMMTVALLCMFIIVGGLVSYVLSKRLYNPIREIKSGLESQHLGDAPGLHNGNEFDMIKRFSRLLISRNKELAQTVDGMFPIVREQFIVKVLLGEYRDSLSIGYYAKEISFPYNPVAAATVLCIEIQYYSPFADQLSETSKSFMLAELKEKIRKLSPAMIWVCQTRSDLLACVLHHEENRLCDPGETANAIKQLLQQPDYKASIGIGKTVHAIAALHQSYNHALSMLKYKSLQPGAEICSEQREWKGRISGDSFLSAHEVNRILNRYKAGDCKSLLQSVFDLLDAGMRSNTNAHQMKNLAIDVLNTWTRAVESERNDFDISVYSEFFAAINRCVTWEEMRQTFRDIHGVLFRTIEPSDRKQQFAEILAYIQNHYNEELSIEYFAEQMNMSAGHFSRMFKEEVGEKYVEYIAKYRISKAKQFLLETDLKIDDIAEQIGYWGRNSFIRNFRRYEGITPAKYRMMHQS
ncbi:helix-turn-helix domain-containing protein [Paenibacillus sp. VCA1]|uniref:helix-turn-helix domain-containing protein n=1 Tax=Paenibacillus sp. VCA1 TaxID=3039148 RepID=UPI002871A85A|nr:helix-turn-helix domain-containing protein [Paenibacillus sp. VCA1]MDR9855099.1 helix-turn-helix domain-containing protein [Paenibacillus sp. VCA1]